MIHFSYGAGAHFLVLREKVDGQPRARSCPCLASSARDRTAADSIPGMDSSTSRGWPAGARTRPPTAAFSACATPVGRFSSRSRSTRTKTACCWLSLRPLDPSDCRPRRQASRPGLELSLQRGLRLARALAAAPRPARSRRPADPLGPRPGRRPEPVPRDPRPSARQSTALARRPGASDGKDQARARCRTSSRRSTGWRRRSPGSRAIGQPPRRSPRTRSWPTWSALSHRPAPNRWLRHLDRARAITIEAGKNLTYSVRSFKVKAGEPIRFTFVNPDSVPHNWALDQARHAGPGGRPGQQDHCRARRGAAALHSDAPTTCSSTPTSSGRRTSSPSSSAPRRRPGVIPISARSRGTGWS